MAESLLAHLYSRIKGSQEDVATMSLQYLLSQSKELNKAFTHLISDLTHATLEETLQYICQSTGEENERPDMVGTDSTSCEQVICEMKFYAGLTSNQPLGYLNRLVKNSGKILVFICPKSRITVLWTKLIDICRNDKRDVKMISDNCACIDGIHMSIITWAEILEKLHNVSSVSAVKYLSDIQQLEGYCEQIDSDAFIPFNDKELSAENAKRIQRFHDVIDETVNVLISDKSLTISQKGKSSSYRFGYEKRLLINDFSIAISFDRNLWLSNNSIETPFWIAISDREGKQTTDILQSLLKIEEHKKDNTVWNWCYLALEPLVNSTLEEVCFDLKRQILEYIDIFKQA